MLFKSKFTVVLSIILIISTFCLGADQHKWTDGGADHLWSTPGNWDIGVPTDGLNDVALIDNGGGSGPLVDSSVLDAVCFGLAVGQFTGPCEFTVDGGNLDVESIWTIVGYKSNGVGTLYMKSGYMETNSMQIGREGTGTLEITGGTLVVDTTLSVPFTTGSGQVNIIDGTLSCGSISVQTGTGQISISEGTFEVAGNVKGTLDEYVLDGRIVGYSGDPRADVDVQYDTQNDKTVVTASLDLTKANTPDPTDGVSGVPHIYTLSWMPGDKAVSHDVYFGESYDDVFAATDPDVLPGRGNQAGTTYGPLNLELGKTYYWKIDEVNGAYPESPWIGFVWSFTTLPYINIDDMESYETGNPIDQAWIPSGGADVELEQGITVHEGTKSMEFTYNGSSKLTMTYAADQDWTDADVKMLELYARGTEGNTGGPLTIELIDSDDDSSGAIAYSDPNLAPGGAYYPWIAWRFDLQDFAINGVDLNKIKKVCIASASGSGTFFLDDIRLRPSGCYEGFGPVGDFNGDCTVNYDDFMTLASDWQRDSVGTNPSGGELLVWYKFDDGIGNYAEDSSGNDYDATAMYAGYGASAEWDNQGQIDGCALFDGSYGFEVPAEALADVNDFVTVTVWVNGDPDMQPASADIIFSAAKDGNMQLKQLNAHVPWSDGNIYYQTGGTAKGVYDFLFWGGSSPEDWEGRWNHYAFTKDAIAGVQKIYLNGELVAEGSGLTRKFDISDFSIGIQTNFISSPYFGKLDDFRIYDYVLSQDEIIAIAQSRLSTDLNEDGVVDIDDLADYFTAYWAKEILWP